MCAAPIIPPGVAEAFSFALGACVASFLNVVIWRVPRGESIVSPPSHCPRCGAAIRWWQNIPVVSWFALRGRCAACKAPISPRYVLVEILGGALFLAAYFKFAAPGCGGCPAGFAALLVAWTWISLMIAGSFIDFDLQLLPDFTTVGGIVLGVAWGAARCIPGLAMDGFVLEAFAPLCSSLAGLVTGFGLLWLIRFFGSKAFGREAMGMGDVFLMGAVGALFGPVAVLVTLMLSSLLGSVAGLCMVAAAKAKLGRFVAIPFGPYICLACLCHMFFGEELVAWYMGLLR